VSEAASATSEAGAGAAAQTQRFRDATEKIRARADILGKTFGGLATTGVTGIGIAKFADVFPWPRGEWLATIALIGGFVTMLIVVIAFTVRLSRVGRPIVMRSDVDLMQELDGRERRIVRTTYDEVGKLNGAASLRAYEARAHRLTRIADRSSQERAKALEAKIAEIRGDVQATEARAQMVVARRRAAKAFTDKKAFLLYALFIAAVTGFGIGADRLDSERSARIEVAEKCAKARDAKAQDLPPICGKGDTEPKTEPTPAEISAKAIADLGTALVTCERERAKRNAPPDTCAPIRRSLAAAARP
jgi:ABC-type multidrug transport system fused ATPase/permease subunit